jgi:hypothetical protein
MIDNASSSCNQRSANKLSAVDSNSSADRPTCMNGRVVRIRARSLTGLENTSVSVKAKK